MSKVFNLKKGLDISLVGGATESVSDASASARYAVTPSDYEGVTPKMLVKAGDKVKAGTALFFDKGRPELLFSSPVSGTVEEIVRGEKRKILEVTITPDSTMEYEQFTVPSSLTKENVSELLISSGLWPVIIQRPYGVIASKADTPKGIFVSMFDSAPLAGDIDFMLDGEKDAFVAGIKALKALSPNVYLSESGKKASKLAEAVKGMVEINKFNGPHPAGNVGIQIHQINPISKGEIAWTLSAQNVVLIGRLMLSGKVDMHKVVAVCGSEVSAPAYKRIISGAQVCSITKGNIRAQKEGYSVRYISGNVLSGKKVTTERAIGFYDSAITVIPEGDHFEFLGWIAPRMDKFSVSRSYFSWLTPKKKYALGTNLNGGERAFVMTGEYEKVLPMDIYPVYLIKAILANDIDKMENLGIYEVIEEDMALCEFVCTSKIEVQSILRDGLNYMIKEV